MTEHKKEESIEQIGVLREIVLHKIKSISHSKFDNSSLDKLDVAMRVFLMKYLGLNYEFTDEELAAELVKKKLLDSLKAKILEMSNLFADIKYHGRKTDELEFKEILRKGIDIINQAAGYQANEEIKSSAKPINIKSMFLKAAGLFKIHASKHNSSNHNNYAAQEMRKPIEEPRVNSKAKSAVPNNNSKISKIQHHPKHHPINPGLHFSLPKFHLGTLFDKKLGQNAMAVHPSKEVIALQKDMLMEKKKIEKEIIKERAEILREIEVETKKRLIELRTEQNRNLKAVEKNISQLRNKM